MIYLCTQSHRGIAKIGGGFEWVTIEAGTEAELTDMSPILMRLCIRRGSSLEGSEILVFDERDGVWASQPGG